MKPWYVRLFENSANQYDKESFTSINGLSPLYYSVEEFAKETHEEGNTEYKSVRFDPITMREYNITTNVDYSGKKKVLDCNERYYIPSEITWLLKTVNYRKIDIYGAKLWRFSR